MYVSRVTISLKGNKLFFEIRKEYLEASNIMYFLPSECFNQKIWTLKVSLFVTS